jgi:alkanesulfonate monooxygenase SsuD/methylene tetrahydromethanopterin reductase-like flavin-dependent oxidoreductase (luciferase family)
MIAKLDAWIETKRMGYDPAVVRIYPADHPAQRAFMAATCDQLYHRHDRWQVVTRNEPGDNRMDPA